MRKALYILTILLLLPACGSEEVPGIETGVKEQSNEVASVDNNQKGQKVNPEVDMIGERKPQPPENCVPGKLYPIPPDPPGTTTLTFALTVELRDGRKFGLGYDGKSVENTFNSIDEKYRKEIVGLDILSYGLIVCDRELPLLKRLPGLQHLTIWGCTGITDKSAAMLADMPRLKTLRLTGCGVGGSNYSIRPYGYPRITDKGLERIATLTKLENLHLWCYHATTNKGIAHLTRLKNLKSLCLEHCREANDKWFEHISSLSQLEGLIVTCMEQRLAGMNRAVAYGGTEASDRITDTSLKHIEKLVNLKRLCIRGSAKITDDGLKRLQMLTRLESLDLLAPGISDAGLQHIGALAGLKTLLLFQCSFIGTGFCHFKKLQKLECVGFYDCLAIGDEGLLHFEKMRGLKTLVFSGCPKITEDAVKKLKSALPNCEIWHW